MTRTFSAVGGYRWRQLQAFEIVRGADVGATFTLSSLSQPSHVVLPDRLSLERPMPRGAAHF